MGCLDGWVPAPRLQGAASWRFGSEWANTPSLYSPPAVPYSRIHPKRSPPQSLEAEGSPGVCVVLSPPHFPVFPWTCLSLSSKQNSGRAPSLPSCPFLGFAPTHRHGTGGNVSNLPPHMGWTQAEAGPSACRWTQTHAAQPAMLFGEALQGLWHHKQDRNVTGLSLTSVLSRLPASSVPFIQLLAWGV